MNTPIVDREIAAEPRAVPEARAAIDVLRGRLSAERFEDLRLMVSELVTNSLRHARLGPSDQINLTVAMEGSVVRVQVCNPGRGFDIPPRDATSPNGGWGLIIVDRLARDWGILGRDATCVWFEMVDA